MSILVLGGNGFIGSNLVKFLVQNGQQVKVLDRSKKSYIELLPQVEYIYGDLANYQVVNQALKGIDTVYHLVSNTIPNTSNLNPVKDVENNLITTIKLLQSCVEQSVKKIIFASSGGTIYGIPQTIPIPENHPTNPICSYGINKLAIEKYLSLFNHLYGLDYGILRISNPYGVGQNPQGNLGAITVFLDKIFRQIPISIWGDGEVVRDYIYIDDVVHSFYLALFNDSPEKIFNISSGYGLSLNQLIDKIKQIIDADFTVSYTKSRPCDIPINCLSNEKAQILLNWYPKVTLKDGILKTWDWINYYYNH